MATLPVMVDNFILRELLDINPTDIKYELKEDFDYINAFALDKLKAIPNPKRNELNVLNHNVIWKIMV